MKQQYLDVHWCWRLFLPLAVRFFLLQGELCSSPWVILEAGWIWALIGWRRRGCGHPGGRWDRCGSRSTHRNYIWTWNKGRTDVWTTVAYTFTNRWGVIWFVHKNHCQTWWSRCLMVFFGRQSCRKMLGEIRGSDRRQRLFGTGLRSGCRCRYLSHLLQYYHNITTFMVLKFILDEWECVWMPVPHEHPVFGQDQWVLSVSLSVPALLQRFQPALHLHTVLWAQSPLVPLCPQTTEDHHHLRPPLPHKQTERGGLSGVHGTWFGIFC